MGHLEQRRLVKIPNKPDGLKRSLTQIKPSSCRVSRPDLGMWERESLAAFKLALDVVNAKGITSKNLDRVDMLTLRDKSFV